MCLCLSGGCFCSVAKVYLTLYNGMDCSMPGFPVLHYLPEFAQVHVLWVGDANDLILCGRLLLLPSIFLSIRVFSKELAFHIRWPKYWRFTFNISPSNEYSGLIPFRIDWFNLHAIQGILKSLLQHHNTKASILWCLAFFTVPTLTSIHNYWENHSFDYIDLCWKSARVGREF